MGTLARYWLKSQKNCENPQELPFWQLFFRAKHPLYRTDSFHYDLCHQICHAIDSCFICWCYFSDTNPDGPVAFSFFTLLDWLSNHVLDISRNVHQWPYVSRTNYVYPIQTLCWKSPLDNPSKLFSHYHYLLSTTHLHYYLCTIHQWDIYLFWPSSLLSETLRIFDRVLPASISNSIFLFITSQKNSDNLHKA